MPRPSSIQASGCSNPLADIRETQAAVRFNGQEQPIGSTEIQLLTDRGGHDQAAAVSEAERERLLMSHS